MSGRGLTSGEISMLRNVYGTSVDYSKVEVSTNTVAGSNAFVLFNTVYFPEKSIESDFSTSTTENKAWFVHEIAHVWQWQENNIVTPISGFSNWVSNGFSYDRSLYKYSINDDFGEMNIEQQAAFIADRFLVENGRSPYDCKDCSGLSKSDLLQKYNGNIPIVGGGSDSAVPTHSITHNSNCIT